jgi:hypothetical protein
MIIAAANGSGRDWMLDRTARLARNVEAYEPEADPANVDLEALKARGWSDALVECVRQFSLGSVSCRISNVGRSASFPRTSKQRAVGVGYFGTRASSAPVPVIYESGYLRIKTLRIEAPLSRGAKLFRAALSTISSSPAPAWSLTIVPHVVAARIDRTLRSSGQRILSSTPKISINPLAEYGVSGCYANGRRYSLDDSTRTSQYVSSLC